MHPALQRNLYLVKEHVGMFKAVNNFDIFDPISKGEISSAHFEFTETTWAIFQATAIEGRPAAEVASVHGRSVGAVYAARCRVAARQPT